MGLFFASQSPNLANGSKRDGFVSQIYPVMLSGGTGSRLWPVSRSQMPKQLMPLLSSRSLLQETALRLAGVTGIAPPLVISNADHRFMIAAQLQELGITPTALVLEPVGCLLYT